VTVRTQTAQDKSDLVAKLGQGGTHTISNFDGSGNDLFSTVNQIDNTATQPYAAVDIYLAVLLQR
jgi:hypothetical protein